MRTLIYIPVIHSGADMGSLAPEYTKKGIAEFGSKLWQNHISTVNSYWDVIEKYCSTLSIDEKGLKIYQDGMVTDGEIALKIIADGVKMGSRNYELLSLLVDRGAEIMMTEKLELVKKELEMMQSIPSSGTFVIKLIKILIFKIKRSSILSQRDKFIVSRINETLKPGETGLIFLGAYHNIIQQLPKDVKIIEVKDIRKVRAYHKLLPFQSNNQLRFQALAEYLRS